MIYEYRMRGVKQDEYDALDRQREGILDDISKSTTYVNDGLRHHIPKSIVNFGYVYRNEWIILKVKRGVYYCEFTTIDRLTQAESAAAAQLFLTLENRLREYRFGKGRDLVADF